MKLVDLHPHMIQGFINGLDGLAPSTVQLVHRIFHSTLEKAVQLNYIPRNPACNCELPRRDAKEIHPLDDPQIAALLDASKGRLVEHLITVALFTGMRQSELLGLTWDAVNFSRGTINVNKQLSRHEIRKVSDLFSSPKNGKARIITAAPLVMRSLQQRFFQARMQRFAGPIWSNPYSLVFTLENGFPISQRMLNYHFQRIVSAAGLEGVRFHDTRHTFASTDFDYS